MKVLVAIDEAACIGPLTEFVRSHQWPDPTEVLVLHVIAPVMYDYPTAGYPLFLETVQQECEETSRKLLDQARQRLEGFGKITVETDSIVGLPVQVINDTAKAWHADMIIVGCHGRHGFNKLIFGSVSQEIASHAPCSVVILRLPVETDEVEGKVSAAREVSK